MTPGASRKVWWICPIGHEWQAAVHSRSRGSACPQCRSSSSLTELRILAELRWIFGEVTHREKHGGLECDIYLPAYRLAIEYDGLRWHFEKELADKAKNQGLRTQGIICIRVRQRGLPKIEPRDLIVDKKVAGSAVTVVQLLQSIRDLFEIKEEHRTKLEAYLRHKDWANEAEYERLLENHPYPLIGLSLQDKFPALGQQWHPTRNKRLTPCHIHPQSSRKVWWRCEKGHEWSAKVAHRVNGSGCPICSGRQSIPETSLKALFPAVAAEWHPHRNGVLTPKVVRPRAGKKVWWQCKKGHEWKTTIASRVEGRGCPYCAGQLVTSETSVAALRPQLVSQWHTAKNAPLTPQDITVSSKKKVWWICKHGHEWQAVVANRSKGVGCPYCAGFLPSATHNLQSKHPQVASEWHPTKNGLLKPSAVVPGSHTVAWWRCSHGHEWNAPIKQRVAGAGCPYCAGRRVSLDNCLATNRENLSGEWHPTRNGSLLPSQVTPGSGRVVWWRCSKGHEWKAAICHRTKGSGCPFCAGRKPTAETCLATTHSELVKQWHPGKNVGVKPTQVTRGSTRKVWWRCAHGHEWRATVGHRTSGRGCPFCARKRAKP